MIFPGEKVIISRPNDHDKRIGLKRGDIITVKRSHERLRRIYFDHDVEGEWWLSFDQVDTMRTPAEELVSQTASNVLKLAPTSDTPMSLTVNLRIGDTVHSMSIKEARGLRNILEGLA